MADLEAYYRKKLQNEYQERLQRNEKYSQNAFAKYLGMTTSYFSKLMNGKILLSLDIADKITKKLSFDFEERKKFLTSVADEQRCHSLYQIDPELSSCKPELTETNELPKRKKE